MKSSVTDLFEGKPTRTAGAKRRGAEAARQPSLRVCPVGVRRLAAAAPCCGSGRQDAHDMERHLCVVIDAVLCKLRDRQQCPVIGGYHCAGAA